jgi:ankyrin repeat protein
MPDINWKLSHMVQPDGLKSEKYQPWSRGRGVDVWAMLCASIAGDLETVKKLVERDPKLIDCEYEYFKPIRFAVRENHRAVVEFLFEKGADPAYDAGGTLVSIARDRDHAALAEFIEEKLKARYRVDPEAATVAEAIKNREMTSVRFLLEKKPDLLHAADEHGNQPIHWAVMTRQTDLIDYLLDRGADINAVRPNGTRPIHLTNGDYHYRGWRDLPGTAMQRHEVLIGYLLARGAEYDITTATKIGDLDRVRELLDRDPGLLNQVPTTSYYSGSPLRNAAGAGHLEVVKYLLQRGADPNLPEPEIAPQGGALHSAIGGKHYEIVKLLLEHGANPNAEVESSGNCLSMAKWSGAPKEITNLIASYGGVRNVELVCHDSDIETLAQMLDANPKLPVGGSWDNRQMMELILRYQPDILKRTPDSTPWWSSATPKNAEYARWLIERGLDPNRPNWLGITLLHRCAAKGDIEVAQVCLDFGADINAVETDSSSTPLAVAARAGKKEMVEWLLKKGADPNVPHDELWARPAEWAKRKGRDEIVEVIEPRSGGR